MECRLTATAKALLPRSDLRVRGYCSDKDALHVCVNARARGMFDILCSTSGGNRGFGPQCLKKDKANRVKVPREGNSVTPQPRKSTSRQSDIITGQAPGLGSLVDGKSRNVSLDRRFEERLEAVQRSALEKKRAEQGEKYQAIDYDAPIETEQSSIGLGTKVGVGVAVVVFGLVFAFGDFLPSERVSSNEESAIVEKKLTMEEKEALQMRLQQYEETLSTSPKDLNALEGAAVTLAELGEYGQAATQLEELTKEKPKDVDAYRLMGEVKYELKDYEGSAAAYRRSLSASDSVNLEVIRGLTNALLAAKKPDEAVAMLLASRGQLKTINMEVKNDDHILVELLLGKAYSDWSHVSDAISVYDRLISMYPDDFRGYLAKGIILKENGKTGDAERMFIQARFFAPEKAKALVDRYSRR